MLFLILCSIEIGVRILEVLVKMHGA